MDNRQHALDILAVGLGRTGGRIAGELCRLGHPALAIHTSARAVEEQPHVPKDQRLYLGNDASTHTGGDPANGVARIRDHAHRIEDLVRSHAQDSDLVLVIGGLGGGTGGALAALIESIDRRDTKVVAMALMPTEGEPVERRIHALKAVEQLTELQPDGLILVDGDKLAAKAAGVSILDYDARVHERAVEPLQTIGQILNRDDLRALRPLSTRQLLDVLTHGGVLAMGSVGLDRLSGATIQDAIRRVLNESEQSADGLDMARASAMQIVIEAPRSILGETPVQMLETLRDDLKAQSPGILCDVSVYQRQQDTAGIEVHVVASVADLPQRLSEMVEDVAHEVASVRDKPRRPPRLDLTLLQGTTANTARTDTNEDSGPRRAPARSDVAPKPEATVSVARGDRGPNAAVYARLVTRYKSSSNDELQRAIARRLEQDRLVDDPRVRALAVGAMAQIGAHVFDGSLFAATEDDSPEVRAIAERALAQANPTRRAM